MSLTRPNEGYKICPHCNGETVCNCGSCGTETTTRARGMGARYMEAGMCKSCNGQGQVIDPDYKPPDTKPSQSNTGCAISAIAILIPVLLTVATVVYAWIN